jgi:hypothetical protein
MSDFDKIAEMSKINMPNLIDTPDIPLNPQKKYRHKAEYVSEYIDDTEKLLVKTSIMDMITLIEDCDEPIEKKKMLNVIKNMVILHGKIIKTMPEFIKNVERSLMRQELQYDILVIHKILYNITNNNLQDNIHFRHVNENIQKYPNIEPEEIAIIARKIKYMRFSYQAKKKHTPFIVGQIVGAKDKEMKWWLSRIIHVHNDTERAGYWYYIRFEGWGPIHDEWIYSETYRVKWFNARKHFLKK